jgi:hypothetical protein
MKIQRVKLLTLPGIDQDSSLSVYYDNRGEPFREGLTIQMMDSEGVVYTMLGRYELEQLRSVIDEALSKGESK